MPISSRKPMCWWCRHLIIQRTETGFDYSCSAFEQIPEPIADGRFDHREEYPGDNGIRFAIANFDDLMKRRFFSRSFNPKGLAERIHKMLQQFDEYRAKGLMDPPIQKTLNGSKETENVEENTGMDNQ